MVLGKQAPLERDMVTPPPPIDDVTSTAEDKENSSPSKGLDAAGQVKGEKPKKKSAMFADTVEVLSLPKISLLKLVLAFQITWPRFETQIQAW